MHQAPGHLKQSQDHLSVCMCMHASNRGSGLPACVHVFGCAMRKHSTIDMSHTEHRAGSGKHPSWYHSFHRLVVSKQICNAVGSISRGDMMRRKNSIKVK